MDRGSGGGAGDLPWASVFDSAANMRALTSIQAEGLRAASGIVERFVRMASAGLTGDIMKRPAAPTDGAHAQDQRADLFGATDVEPLLKSLWSIYEQMMGGSAGDARTGGANAGDPTLDLAQTEGSGRVDLDASSVGVVTAEVWLHNTGRSDLGRVHLRCSDLLSSDGCVLRAGAVTIAPEHVPMPARSSRGVCVAVSVDDDLVPGLYRGTLLAEGYPELWLPVALTVHRR